MTMSSYFWDDVLYRMLSSYFWDDVLYRMQKTFADDEPIRRTLLRRIGDRGG